MGHMGRHIPGMKEEAYTLTGHTTDTDGHALPGIIIMITHGTKDHITRGESIILAISKGQS